MKNNIDKNTEKKHIEQYDSEFIHKLIKRVINMNCEEIIKEHRSLINCKILPHNYVGNYGKWFIFGLLNHDYGYCFPKETPRELDKFFHSQYFSNIYKEIIQEELEKSSINVPKIIKSDKNISEFTEKDFYEIDFAYQQQEPCDRIFNLTFRLNTEGARNFLLNRVEPMKLIKRIVLTSGLNSRAEYYSGRGAIMSDLNGKHLIAIYQKLARLDRIKALNMMKMTLHMPTLGATEFLESLYNLVENNYVFEKTIISTNNLSLGSARTEERNSIAIASIATFLCGSKRDETATIKAQFISLLPQEVVVETYDNKIGRIYNQYNEWGSTLYGEYRRTRKNKL